MKIKAKGPDFVELDYTPMIDMTFQLIAFFMILINFSDAETDDRVQLPSSAIAKPPSAPVGPTPGRSQADNWDALAP